MGSISQLSMEDYIELYIALTKSGDKVATFDARGEACFTAKDLAQVLALHGLGDGRSGSRKKREVLASMQGMQLIPPLPVWLPPPVSSPAAQQSSQQTADRQPRITSFFNGKAAAPGTLAPSDLHSLGWCGPACQPSPTLTCSLFPTTAHPSPGPPPTSQLYSTRLLDSCLAHGGEQLEGSLPLQLAVGSHQQGTGLLGGTRPGMPLAELLTMPALVLTRTCRPAGRCSAVPLGMENQTGQQVLMQAMGPMQGQQAGKQAGQQAGQRAGQRAGQQAGQRVGQRVGTACQAGQTAIGGPWEWAAAEPHPLPRSLPLPAPPQQQQQQHQDQQQPRQLQVQQQQPQREHLQQQQVQQAQQVQQQLPYQVAMLSNQQQANAVVQAYTADAGTVEEQAAVVEQEEGQGEGEYVCEEEEQQQWQGEEKGIDEDPAVEEEAGFYPGVAGESLEEQEESEDLTQPPPDQDQDRQLAAATHDDACTAADASLECDPGGLVTPGAHDPHSLDHSPAPPQHLVGVSGVKQGLGNVLRTQQPGPGGSHVSQTPCPAALPPAPKLLPLASALTPQQPPAQPQLHAIARPPAASSSQLSSGPFRVAQSAAVGGVPAQPHVAPHLIAGLAAVGPVQQQAAPVGRGRGRGPAAVRQLPAGRSGGRLAGRQSRPAQKQLQLQPQPQQMPGHAPPAAVQPGQQVQAQALPQVFAEGQLLTDAAARLGWLAHEVVRFSQEAAVVASEEELPPHQLVSRRIGFLLLQPMEHKDRSGAVEGVLQPGVHQGAVARRIGSSCQPDLCDPGCRGGHEFCLVRVLTQLRRPGTRLELMLDLAPALRLPQLAGLLGLVHDVQALGDAWMLLRPSGTPSLPEPPHIKQEETAPRQLKQGGRGAVGVAGTAADKRRRKQ